GRCLVHFANFLGIIEKKAVFEAIDGVHEATINEGFVSLKMNDVDSVLTENEYSFLNTDSPHNVELCNQLDQLDIQTEGAKLRYDKYGKEGANINFVAPLNNDTFSVRTYERGVEAETLSCGTGVTAVALAMHKTGKTTSEAVNLK